MEVQVNAPQPLLATQLQQQLGYRLHTADFSRQLAALLDGLVHENEYIEIPSLAISLECSDEAEFNQQLLSQLAVAIKEQLTTPHPDNMILPNSAAYTEMLQLFFLKYGIRAFYNGEDLITALQAELKVLPDREQPQLEKLLKKAGKNDPVVWARLYYLLGAAGMKKFFLRTFACQEDTLQALIRQESGRTDKPVISTATPGSNAAPATTTTTDGAITLSPDVHQWPLLFQYMLAGNEIPPPVSATTSNNEAVTPSHSAGATPAISPVEAAVSLTAQLQRGLQIENAGLVLLWMECGRLFRTLGYVADRQFVDETTQQRAILLLHYICYGEDGAGNEEDWLLNKLLCNWPLHMPVDPELRPGQAEKGAATDMLTAYLEAWRKDRKFSAAWFSTAFLQREGQLSRRSDGVWTLTVAARTEDIIINKVSMVKYAWMPQILYVQW
jgi:Contractile injection system tape measure protein